MADDDSPLKEAVRKVADHIADAIRSHSPSAKIAGSWKVSQHADDSVHVVSRDMAAVMTETGHRHPLFGNKKHWYAENEHSPERTGWVERAAQEGLDDLQDVADEYADYIATELSS
jgi:hypothetical protein